MSAISARDLGEATGRTSATERGADLVRSGVRNTSVVVYLVLTVMALLPGLILKFGLDGLFEARGRAALSDLDFVLSDIRFGSGLRFWLGVAGATMMGLLLLYPLRKMFAKGRKLGAVGGWFHLHILLGFIGPVLILYHANFGHGGSNANVALWTMLIVAISGIIGFFVYSRVSHNFYSARQQAQRHRDAIIGLVPDVDQIHASRDKLASSFDGFEADLLTPRQGVLASLRARLRVEQYRRELVHDTVWLLDECARRMRLDAHDHDRLRASAGSHLRAYFQLARSGASASVREQLWARWRLFHLPVFLIMVVAAVLHVIAVWGMDDASFGLGQPVLRTAVQPAARSMPTQSTGGQSTGAQSVAVQPMVLPPKLPRIVVVPPGDQTSTRSAHEDDIRTVDNRDVEKPRSGQASDIAVVAVRSNINALPSKSVTDTASETTIDSLLTSTATTNGPAAAPKPTPAMRKPERPVVSPRVVAVPQPVIVQATAATSPALQPPLQQTPAQDMKQLYSELQRKTETAPMGLGAPKPRTLAEQIATLKAKQKAGEFAHSITETGFALTGKHLKADCADCHTAPLKDVRQATVRQCIACHKSDDVHRGRRPDCAQCHTTKRWSEIIRKR